ncbi:MAG: two-component regulator propeller domain-containing protein, partial [Limisphaerales bacterium]
GAGFTVFTPDNTPALPSAGIVNLHADRRGRLWVSTYAGLVVWENGGPDVGGRGRPLSRIEGWSADFARSFTERANGDLLITSFNGRVFEFAGDRLGELPPPPGEAGQGYHGGVDEEGRWWAVQNRFAGRWEDGRWVAKLMLPELPSDAVGCTAARDGGLWLLLGQELVRLRGGRETARVTLSERPGGVWSLAEDGRGHVWIATYDQGACRVTVTNGLLARWHGANGASDHVRGVFEDREGSLWLGTSGDGLLRFTPRRFRHFDLAGGRRGRVVSSLAPDGDGVWAGTYGQGVFRVDDAGAVRRKLSGVPTSYVQSVLVDRAGGLWVGTYGRALWQLEAGRLRDFPGDAVGGGNMLALFEDSRGRIWTGGGSTVAVREDGTFRRLETGPEGALGGVIAFAEDAARAVWMANPRTVFRHAPGTGLTEVRDADQQAIPRITSLLGDADGAMWLGTSDRGLLRWGDGRLAVIGPAAGLPTGPIRGLLDDGHEFLWMTTARSVLRAVADGRQPRLDVQVFDASDGLPRAEFTGGRHPTAGRDARGRLWFATQKGVVMVDPSALRLNPLPPPVHLEEVSFDQPASRAHGAEARTRLRGPFAAPVTLPAGSRRVEIRYSGLSFAAPDKMRFQTRLEGREAADWQEAGGRRSAYFEELAPGSHVFRVRAANNDGVWNEAGAALAFTMLPHFWQTPWFRFGGAALLVGLGGSSVWWGTRTRVRRALERERAAGELRELAGRLIHAQEDERRRLARELHDDFSQRLALLSVEMELQGAAAGRESAAALAGMASRVKELSTEVHRMAYDLHPAKLDQLGLVAAARGCCRELAQQSGLKIAFEPGELPRDLPAGVALCFYRLIQEALQNTVRHAGAREARVALGAAPGRVWLAVSDDGRGFDVERARRAGRLGLSSMQERVRQVRGELKIESSPGRGTRIEASAPLAGTEPKPK